MQLKLITAPEVPAVSLADMKKWLRYPSNAEDDVIVQAVEAAQGELDARNGRLNRALITQTWELALPRFWRGPLALPFAPLQSVDAITYRTSGGADVTLDAALYEVDASNEPGTVSLAADAEWPTDLADRINAVRIEFTCGYGETSADVPARLRTAICMMAAGSFGLREASVTGTILTQNPAVERMLAGMFVYNPHALRLT